MLKSRGEPTNKQGKWVRSSQSKSRLSCLSVQLLKFLFVCLYEL